MCSTIFLAAAAEPMHSCEFENELTPHPTWWLLRSAEVRLLQAATRRLHRFCYPLESVQRREKLLPAAGGGRQKEHVRHVGVCCERRLRSGSILGDADHLQRRIQAQRLGRLAPERTRAPRRCVL